MFSKAINAVRRIRELVRELRGVREERDQAQREKARLEQENQRLREEIDKLKKELEAVNVQPAAKRRPSRGESARRMRKLQDASPEQSTASSTTDRSRIMSTRRLA